MASSQVAVWCAGSCVRSTMQLCYAYSTAHAPHYMANRSLEKLECGGIPNFHPKQWLSAVVLTFMMKYFRKSGNPKSVGMFNTYQLYAL